MQILAKYLKLADGNFVNYNIKSTPPIRMKSMLQQWLDYSENPTWAEFTHAMENVGKYHMFFDYHECEKLALEVFDMS